MTKRSRIQIGPYHMPYEVIRAERTKSVGFEVRPYRGVVVRAPKRLSHTRIREILVQRSHWIQRFADLFQQNGISLEPRKFCSGERVLLLGEWLTLKVVPTPSPEFSAVRRDGYAVVHVPPDTDSSDQPSLVKGALVVWYRRQAAGLLAERVAKYAPRAGLAVPPIRVGNARRQWGSCSPRGALTFTWRLLMAEMRVVDYVVVHELCHLLQRDHSPVFWKHVASLLPDHASARERLRVEGPMYDL